MNRSRKEIPNGDNSFGNRLNKQNSYRKKDLSESSDISAINIIKKPVVMSTPKRTSRNSAPLLESSNSNQSRSFLSRNESFSQKKYHKTYDPDIEIRQVNERQKKRLSKSWADQTILVDQEDEDLQKYSGKQKKINKNIKLEEDTDVLARRQGEIDKGKIKQCYRNYVYQIDKNERKNFMPRTPNKFIKMSRRGWDGLVRKWKKHIHAWNEPNFEELFATGMDFDCCSEASISARASLDSSIDNLERQEEILFAKDEEEETLQGPSTRKRPISPINFDKENCDEDTVEKSPLKRESRLRDLHTGLTNDAAALTVAPVKRQRLSHCTK